MFASMNTISVYFFLALAVGVGSPSLFVNAQEVALCQDAPANTDSVFWYAKGQELIKLRNFEESIKCFDKTIELNPNYIAAWYGKGASLEALDGSGDFEYGATVKIDPVSAEDWLYRGNALSRLDHYEDAIESYDRALQLEPNNAAAWLGKATALLYDPSRWGESLDFLNKAMEIDPNNGETWLVKGNVLSGLGRYEEAIESYDKGIEVNQGPKIWFKKGIAQSALGRYEAIISFDKAIELMPDFADAWAAKGGELEKLGRYDDAINSFDKALDAYPDHPEWWSWWFSKAKAQVNLFLQNFSMPIRM